LGEELELELETETEAVTPNSGPADAGCEGAGEDFGAKPTPPGEGGRALAVVSEEFSKKADHGRRFGEQPTTTRTKENP
jgi:hypothetical protein